MSLIDSLLAMMATPTPETLATVGTDAGDVVTAGQIAQRCAALLPRPTRAKTDPGVTKATAHAVSLALALGDRALNRQPSPASLHGWKVLGSSAPASAVASALGALIDACACTGIDLDTAYEDSRCKLGRGDKPIGKAVGLATTHGKALALLTGAAALAGVTIDMETVLASAREALADARKRKAA